MIVFVSFFVCFLRARVKHVFDLHICKVRLCCNFTSLAHTLTFLLVIFCNGVVFSVVLVLVPLILVSPYLYVVVFNENGIFGFAYVLKAAPHGACSPAFACLASVHECTSTHVCARICLPSTRCGECCMDECRRA